MVCRQGAFCGGQSALLCFAMKSFCFSQAIQFLQKGDAASAQDILLQFPVSDAHHAFLLGACAHALNDIPRSISYFSEALSLNPTHAQAAAALGSLLAGLGKKAEAESVFRKALEHNDDSQLRFNLAVVMEDAGRTREALEEYSYILENNTEHYAARHNRAGLHAREKRFNEAIIDYRKLTVAYPQEMLPWHNLAELELANGHYEEAIRLLKKVIERAPDNGKAWLSYAVAQAAHGDMVESDAAFKKLKAVDETLWQDASLRINNKRVTGDIDPRMVFLVRARDHLSICHWRYWQQTIQVYESILAKPSLADMMVLGFITLFIPFDAGQQRTLMQAIAKQIEEKKVVFPPVPISRPTSKIRIAYLAPNWGNHVTAYQAKQLLISHDHDFEVHVASLQIPDESENVRQLKENSGVVFHDLSKMSDEEAAKFLYALDLDIAVDMAVYSNENRPGILAYRPARVQIARQGAPYTSGASWMDYVVSDEYVRPTEGWCTEAEILMPSCYFAFSSEKTVSIPVTKKQAGLPEDKFVFSSLNNALKINPLVFPVWMEILKDVPESVLWLLASSSAEIANLRREAEWAGVDSARLIFANRVKPEEHMARMSAADLFLDTWPCNAHTTMAESLWAGTPAISLKGNTFAGRVGGSMLSAVGLGELIAETAESYKALAVALYRDRNRLSGYRNHLAEARFKVDFLNPERQVKHFEKAFREVVRRNRMGQAAKTLRVEEC